MIAAVFWRMAYLVRLNSPQSKVRVAADWISAWYAAAAQIQTLRGIAVPLRRDHKGAR